MAMNNMSLRDAHSRGARRPVGVCRYDIVFALSLAFSFGYALMIGVFKRMGHQSQLLPFPIDLLSQRASKVLTGSSRECALAFCPAKTKLSVPKKRKNR
jgi:hypothetical protein